jgi:hypothetical protein
MKTSYDFLQIASVKMRIDFGRCKRGVPQQFLNDAQIRAAFEKVRRERMTQGVR